MDGTNPAEETPNLKKIETKPSKFHLLQTIMEDLNNLVISQDDLLTLQKSFFKEKGLVRQHLDSYNKFIDSGLQEVIDEIGEINIEIPRDALQNKTWSTLGN